MDATDPRRPMGRTGLAVAGAAAAVAVAAGAVVAACEGADSPDEGATAPPTVPVRATPVVPAPYVGTWQGTVTQAGPDGKPRSFRLHVVLRPGRDDGQLLVSPDGCRARWPRTRWTRSR